MEHDCTAPAPIPPMDKAAAAAAQEEILLEPYTYLMQAAGKEVRTMLILAFNAWLQVPEDKVAIIRDTVKMLHNASLLIDDIEDNSCLRRGQPVAHHVFGIAKTINCANYVYFQCMEKIMAFRDVRAVQAFTEQLLDLHRGQGMDIHWRDAVVCPTEAEYRAMVIQKTGGLFRLAVRLMQLYSANQSDFVPLLDVLGLYFQIRDDYANLMSREYSDNKSFCEDITEGKFSFPIIHSIRSTPGSHQVVSILRQRTEDVDLKRHLLSCLERTGSFAYTRQVLRELEAEALRLIEELGGNAMLAALFDRLRPVYADPAPQ